MERRVRSSSRTPIPQGQFHVGALAVIVLLSIAAAGGYWWWNWGLSELGATNAILHTVKRGDFVLDVIERGEIESSGLNEVRSLVKSKNTPGVAILKIVPEGTEVKQGDFLVELDSSALKEQLTTQQIAVAQVEALVVEARNLYETAQIAEREYLEGTYVQERQTLESAVFVAEENLNRAREYYEYSKKLQAKGYVNELQLEADKFAVDKSTKELDAAKTSLQVLDEFTKAKTLKQLDSDISIAKAKWEAQQHSYDLEYGKLQDLEEQIAECTIVAPRDGTVVYAHVQDRRGDDNFIVEEGAVVRERQAIIYLPDPSSMRVELTINESLIQYVKKGMPAKIEPVGLGDLVLKGTVLGVNQYAEPSGWRKANVKEYKAYVKIDSPTTDLRAGLTASVTIRCVDVPDALQVPVQAVYSHGPQFYCFVFDNGRWEARKVECGPTNDRFFVIESGLQEGERVALNPRRYIDQVKLPKLPPEQRQRAVPQPPGDAEESVAGDS
jgi:HlyD family secretion protein